MSKRFQKSGEPRAAAKPPTAVEIPKPRKKPGRAPFSVGMKPEALATDDEDDGIVPPRLTDTISNRATESVSIEHALEMLGQMWATTREVSAFLRITEKTLFKLFRNEPRAKELYERGKLMGNVSQRRRNIAHAEKNVIMSIFLSKNHLGMSDQVNLSGTISHQHEVLVSLYEQIGKERTGKMIEAEAVDVTPGKVIEAD